MLAWVLHTLKHGWFLGKVCNRKNILNTTIHEAVYYPPYSGLEQQAYLHFSTLASIELSNLSLAPGSYENWRGYINRTTFTPNYWAHAGYNITTDQFKGTVSVSSSEPVCKNGNARFTTITLEIIIWLIMWKIHCRISSLKNVQIC